MAYRVSKDAQLSAPTRQLYPGESVAAQNALMILTHFIRLTITVDRLWLFT